MIPDADLGPTERWIRSRAAAATASVDRGIADYQFAEVTRALYDGIWSEFCDWGIELAKVRLGDAALSGAERAATWWTVVEALDTYLRLLHPVMPFVTEAIWGSLPHRPEDPGLLMIADWPGGAEPDRVLDARVGAVLETIVAIRNARATAGVPAGAWLESHLAVPDEAFELFDAVSGAIARLARGRPLILHRGAADLPRPGGALEVVLAAGGIEATILAATQVAGPDADADRARLEKELAQAEGHLAAARERLANGAFTGRAPAPVVEGARAREAELAEQVERLRTRLAD